MEELSVSMFHFPFCEKKIVGLSNFRFSTLPIVDLKVHKLNPVSCFIIGVINLF